MTPPPINWLRPFGDSMRLSMPKPLMLSTAAVLVLPWVRKARFVFYYRLRFYRLGFKLQLKLSSCHVQAYLMEQAEE
jgi:hypothetical protein